jgi:hypothetical protein
MCKYPLKQIPTKLCASELVKKRQISLYKKEGQSRRSVPTEEKVEVKI